MAASAPLSTVILDGAGSSNVAPYSSPFSSSGAHIPKGWSELELDVDLQAGYVVLFPLFDSAF